MPSTILRALRTGRTFSSTPPLSVSIPSLGQASSPLPPRLGVAQHAIRSHHQINGIQLARYDSSVLGIALSTDDPTHESTSEIIKDVLSFHLTFQYGSQVETALSVTAMLIGLTLVFLGVRLFRPLLFALTWLLVGGAVFFISMLVSSHNSMSSFIAGCVIGLVFAALTIKIWRLALFIAGGAFGFVLWLMFQSLFPSVMSTPAAMYSVLAVAVLVCGYIGMSMEKIALLASTPVLGAFLFLQGLNHFIRSDVNAFQLLTSQGERMCQSNGWCFGLYAAIIGLAAAGMVVQWKYTADLAPIAKSATSPKVHREKSKQKNAPEMIILSSPKNKKQNPFLSNYHPSSPTVRSPFSSTSSRARSCYSSSPSASSGYGNPFGTNSRSGSSSYGYDSQPSVETEYFEG